MTRFSEASNEMSETVPCEHRSSETDQACGWRIVIFLMEKRLTRASRIPMFRQSPLCRWPSAAQSVPKELFGANSPSAKGE